MYLETGITELVKEKTTIYFSEQLSFNGKPTTRNAIEWHHMKMFDHQRLFK